MDIIASTAVMAINHEIIHQIIDHVFWSLIVGKGISQFHTGDSTAMFVWFKIPAAYELDESILIDVISIVSI